jgi:hypothetical protein
MEKLHVQVRRLIIFFMITLALSGITAVPVEKELSFVVKMTEDIPVLNAWLQDVLDGYRATNNAYPFLMYGYDWLAFAHIVLAILFLGPFHDPVKNVWVIEFGMFACLLVIPFALIAGYFREIPFWWRLVDCSFGVIGLIPLGICLKKIRQLEELKQTQLIYGDSN